MTANWFYAIDGQRLGPTDWTKLEHLLAAGELNDQSLVWCKGMEQWQPISEVAPPPLPASSEPVPPPPVNPTQPKPLREMRARTRQPARPAAVSISQGQLVGILVGVVLATAALSAWIAVLATQSNNGLKDSSGEHVAVVDPSPESRPNSLPRKVPDLTTDPITPDDPPATPPPSEPKPEPIDSAFPTVDSDSAEPMKVEVIAPAPPEAEPTNPIPPDEPPKAASDLTQPPAVEQKQPVFAWLGGDLFQETNVRRRTQFTMVGRPVTTSQEYQILSKLNVGKAGADGSFPVTQTILDARLHGADELSRPAMAADLKGIIGDQFGYRVHPAHGILDFARVDAVAKGAAVKNDTIEGMFTGAAMDVDGWRELAHLTFLQPPKPLTKGLSWQRQILHDWKSLGVWSGDTEFAYDGRRKDSDWIKYSHDLTWKAPAAGAKASMLNITSARFDKATATGMVEYDPDQRRVLAAEESFSVKGVMQAELAGQAIPIEMTEMQSHGIRVLDQNPWRQ